MSNATVEPVAWDATLGGWTVSSYELIRRALRDPQSFTSEGSYVADGLAGEAMLVTDSPVHDAVRSLWSGTFSPASVASLRSDLVRSATQLLVPVLKDLSIRETVDLVPLFEQFAGTVVLDLIGIPQIDLDQFGRWYKLLLGPSAFDPTDDPELQAERQRAKAEIYHMLEAELEARQAQPAVKDRQSDLVSLIAGAEGTRGITRKVALDNLNNVLTGGADTTVRWMGNAIVTFDRHRDVMDEVRANPALLPQALEEVMRFDPVIPSVIRTVRKDGVELAGHALSRGDTVHMLIGPANRDPAAFDDPDRFDIHRRGKSHLGFSHGMHQCIGMHLARVEAQALIAALLKALPRLEVLHVGYGEPGPVSGPQELLVRAR